MTTRRRHTRYDRDWSAEVCSFDRSEEHSSELQSRSELVGRLLIVTGVQTCALPSDRKSTRLNSSHDQISYDVFCLKNKQRKTVLQQPPAIEWRQVLETRIHTANRYRQPASLSARGNSRRAAMQP